jgi:hypothetical protein
VVALNAIIIVKILNSSERFEGGNKNNFEEVFAD